MYSNLKRAPSSVQSPLVWPRVTQLAVQAHSPKVHLHFHYNRIKRWFFIFSHILVQSETFNPLQLAWSRREQVRWSQGSQGGEEICLLLPSWRCSLVSETEKIWLGQTRQNIGQVHKWANGQVVYYLVEVLSHQVVGRDWWLVMCIRAGPAAAAPPVQPTIGDRLSAVVLQYQWIHWTVLAEQQNSFDQFPQKSILTMDIKVKAACASTTWVKLVSCFTIWKDTEAINRIHIFLDSQASSSSCKVLFA